MLHTPARLWQSTPFPEHVHEERAEIDFETRSPVPIGGPKGRGAHLYAKNKHTRILCLAFLLPGQCPLHPSLWAPAMGGYPEERDFPLDDEGVPYDLERLFAHIRAGKVVEAHNVNFEAEIWEHIAVRPMGGDENGATGMGAPPLKDTQLRCSAAKAASFALPRDLEGAGEALDIPFHLRKHSGAGKQFINRHCKPRKPRKGEETHDWVTGEEIVYYHEYDREEFLAGYRYCKQDVSAENAISTMLPDIGAREQAVWLADFRANRRGVRVDVDLVRAAIKLGDDYKADLNRTLRLITGIEKGTARAQVLAWLAEHGVELPDSQAETLDHLIGSEAFKELPAEVREVVHIARNINRTSVSKFKRILDCMDPDDHRVRELVMYHGAATGRWSGKGIQVQNFPKGLERPDLLGIPNGHPLASMEVAVADVKTKDLGWLKLLYGDVLTLLSSVARGCLIPTKGKVFYVADYAAIEARVVLWLAGAKKALEVFERGDDIYMDMASGIYGYPVTDKKKQARERGFGKVAILGLGYGMGYLTFLLTMRGAPYNIKFTRAAALEILGEHAERYIEWVKEQLWPEQPEAADFKKPADYAEALRKWKVKKRAASANIRRLEEAREDASLIIEELALCKYVVDTYRKRYPEVKKLWADQEAAACRAVAKWKDAKELADSEWETTKGRLEDMALHGGNGIAYRPPTPLQPVECGKVTWVVEYDRWLFCYLPSGRRIAYNCPDVKGVKTPWGEKRLSLRFMGVVKATRHWGRMGTYGGSIVENIDQGTARDIMADAMARIDSGYESETEFDFITSIHDEGLAEGDDCEDLMDFESGRMFNPRVREYEGLMEHLAPCYAGLPIAAEGEKLSRYQK